VILLAYYGDDFTGSTDALEALTTSGVETVLFTEPPDEQRLAQFPHARAIGIAGNSRCMTPAQMDQALPAAFESLLAHRPAVVHYKVCSTFDSSSEIGSIGRAIDIGQRVFQNHCVPLVVGAPGLQRFCVFGNLFARSGLDSPVYRLDRHPTMSRHPVTPMTEADLRVHLWHQTSRPVRLVDALTLDRGPALVEAAVSGGEGDIVLFDTVTGDHLATIGQHIWEAHQREQKPLFVAGSSGIESALTSHWRRSGISPSESKGFAPSRPVEHAVVISGSCSPVTGRQIAWALANGFAEVPLDTVGLVQSSTLEADIAAVAGRVVTEIEANRRVIVHTSRGPDDQRIASTRHSAQSRLTGAALGVILGRILDLVLQSQPVERVAVAGGDTSGAVARAIGIESLEMVGPLAPGAPLCVAHSRRAEIEGVEFTFKGGQVGHDDFFGSLLRGGPNR
jgi:3-oxoisoapionate kinase